MKEKFVCEHILRVECESRLKVAISRASTMATSLAANAEIKFYERVTGLVPALALGRHKYLLQFFDDFVRAEKFVLISICICNCRLAL